MYPLCPELEAWGTCLTEAEWDQCSVTVPPPSASWTVAQDKGFRTAVAVRIRGVLRGPSSEAALTAHARPEAACQPWLAASTGIAQSAEPRPHLQLGTRLCSWGRASGSAVGGIRLVPPCRQRHRRSSTCLAQLAPIAPSRSSGRVQGVSRVRCKSPSEPARLSHAPAGIRHSDSAAKYVAETSRLFAPDPPRGLRPSQPAACVLQ
jgi:hypothetical protein